MKKLTHRNKTFYWEIDKEIKNGSWWIDNSKYQYVKIFDKDKKQLDVYCGTSCMVEDNTKENKDKLIKEIQTQWVPESIDNWFEEEGTFVKRDTDEPDKLSYTELKKENLKLKKRISDYGLDYRGMVYTYMIDYMSIGKIPFEAHMQMFRQWLEDKIGKQCSDY